MQDSLIWDYKNGFVVDSSTGEVVDTIYIASQYDGLRGRELAGRVHYSALSDYRFEAVDEVAEQIRELKLSPTWCSTYIYMRFHSGDRKSEKKLLSVYKIALSILSNIASASPDTVERVVRDAHALSPRADPHVLAVAAVYTAARLLGAPVDIDAVARGLGLSSIGIGKALKIALKLSRAYKCNRAEAVAKLIDRAASELKHPQLSTAAKILFKKCSNILSGRTSRVVAGGLLYLSSLLTGASVYGESISRAVGASPPNVSSMSKRIAAELGIAVTRSRAYVVVSVVVPKELCKELESAGVSLASYVECR